MNMRMVKYQVQESSVIERLEDQKVSVLLKCQMIQKQKLQLKQQMKKRSVEEL
ncbi:MAG: hypothetical protein H6Q35_1563 [Proteobacteria bacterium]|nr:hypothetical protein [Pseudomonadota bacterium]